MRVTFGEEMKNTLDDIVIYNSESVNEFCGNPDSLRLSYKTQRLHNREK